jgi:hypothetical protein
MLVSPAATESQARRAAALKSAFGPLLPRQSLLSSSLERSAGCSCDSPRSTATLLARRFLDHVRTKRSSGRDEGLLRLYVLPHMSDVRVDEFDLHDAEVVMASLPEINARTGRALAPATADKSRK